MKKYSFMIFVVLLGIALFITGNILSVDEEKFVYSPRTDLSKPAPTALAEPENHVIKRTKLVYFYDDSKVFHIKPDCSGMGTIQGRPCGQALDMGIRPCEICMKDYVIQ